MATRCNSPSQARFNVNSLARANRKSSSHLLKVETAEPVATWSLFMYVRVSPDGWLRVYITWVRSVVRDPLGVLSDGVPLSLVDVVRSRVS